MPLQVFFNILDLADINAWILYKQTTGENISRQEFLLKLAVELGADFREAREQPKQRKNSKVSLPKSTADGYQQAVIHQDVILDTYVRPYLAAVGSDSMFTGDNSRLHTACVVNQFICYNVWNSTLK
ncbi:uncharacterized protein TNCV_4622771 [Trichonephila clavipes]|nr:uncharacterized protein TNCV_4622771 [Trichonephila clavipes]